MVWGEKDGGDCGAIKSERGECGREVSVGQEREVREVREGGEWGRERKRG